MPDALGPLETAPAYLIYRLSRLLRLSLRKTLHAEGLDVTPEQYFLLYKLFETDGLAHGELADEALGDYPNMTRMIDGLEGRGLAERRPDPQDRRRSLVWLTDKGRATMDTLRPAIHHERERLFGAFDDETMSTFASVLTQLQTKLIA